MTYTLYRDAVAQLSLRFVEEKRDGWFQYRRRIPSAVQKQCPGKRFFVVSLGRGTSLLAARVAAITLQLEREWTVARPQRGRQEQHESLSISLPWLGSKLHAPGEQVDPLSHPTITQAINLYLQQHPKGEDRKFRLDNERAVSTLIRLFGNRPIHLYSREDAAAFRDSILATNSTGTTRRYLNRLAAIISKAKRELQLQVANPFEGLGIPLEGRDQRHRSPYTPDELSRIAIACRRRDDDIRHIIGLQIDTGARAGEIVGLRIEDVVLDHVVPHVHIRPFGVVRTLKTPASQRVIPLVGEALWAASRALAANKDTPGSWLFPRYASDRGIKATHASNTLNKWLRTLSGVSAARSTHSFRHAMRDRLRSVEVASDIQDAIGGWGYRTTGQRYGLGYPLEVLERALQKVVLIRDKTPSNIASIHFDAPADSH